jgi:hypothetical protein
MVDDLWSLGDVLESVEHPRRMVRTCPEREENSPFRTLNQLGEILNEFSKEDQEMYISNLIDTLEQLL